MKTYKYKNWDKVIRSRDCLVLGQAQQVHDDRRHPSNKILIFTLIYVELMKVHLDIQCTLSAGSLKAASLLNSACDEFTSQKLCFKIWEKNSNLCSRPRALVLISPWNLEVPVVGTDHLREPANVLLQNQIPRYICLSVGVQSCHVNLQTLKVKICSQFPWFTFTSENIALSTAFLASCRWSSLVAASIGSCSRASHILRIIDEKPAGDCQKHLFRNWTTKSVFSSITLVEENWTLSCCNSSSLLSRKSLKKVHEWMILDS